MQQTEITVQVFETKNDIFKKLKNLGYNIVENYQLNDWYFTKLDNEALTSALLSLEILSRPNAILEPKCKSAQ